MKHIGHGTHLALALTLAAAGLAACAADNPVEEPGVSTIESEITCTPGFETCDVGCFYDGGPSTDDCIIRCNAAGNGWITLANCGWAQNFPFSASCLPSQPPPVCQKN
jgi:hypothetical protein